MVAAFPNRKCTCGYTIFRDRRTPSVSSVTRWMLYDDTTSGGFGSTPAGSTAGGSGSGAWGEFAVTNISAVIAVLCESCRRIRSSRVFGGITPVGVYVEDGLIYIVASDATKDAPCYSLRFDSSDEQETHTSQLALVSAVIPPTPAPSTPLQTAESPPAGASVADKLLCAALPEVNSTDDYSVTLVDNCSGLELVLTTVYLESPPMILKPSDADLNGAPRQWLTGGSTSNPSSQPPSGSRQSIPLDRCTGVVEYDARRGTLPSNQGWTHQGSGSASDYQLVKGGVLRISTTNTLDSYWEQTLVLSAAPSRLFSYVVLKDDDSQIGGGSPADGLDFEGRYATAVSSPYSGVRYSYADQSVRVTKLDATSDAALLSTLPPGWVEVAAGDEDGVSEVAWTRDSTLLSAAFGGDGSAGALEMIGRFGDRNANGGLIGYIRNYVLSAEGRFVRASWTAYTQVTDPYLRLYLVADDNSSTLKTARFLIRYGTGTSDPYAEPVLTAGATLNFVSTNAVFELPIQLTGLTANKPFWFSVERDWDNGDDALEATVHLLQATVRSV